MNLRLIFVLLLAACCCACQAAPPSDISAGAAVVALRGDSYLQGVAEKMESSRWLVKWDDGALPVLLPASELSIIKSLPDTVSAGQYGLCRSRNAWLWSICRIEAVSSEGLSVTLLEDAIIESVSLADFILPAIGQQNEFVRRSAALLRKERRGGAGIKAVKPPAGLGLPVKPNMLLLLQVSDGEFLRGLCGRVDGDSVYATPQGLQYVLNVSSKDAAPLYGMEFDREAYRKKLKVDDIIYASPDSIHFLPARVESILEEGRLVRVVFKDGLSMELSEEFWLPQSN